MNLARGCTLFDCDVWHGKFTFQEVAIDASRVELVSCTTLTGALRKLIMMGHVSNAPD